MKVRDKCKKELHVKKKNDNEINAEIRMKRNAIAALSKKLCKVKYR